MDVDKADDQDDKDDEDGEEEEDDDEEEEEDDGGDDESSSVSDSEASSSESEEDSDAEEEEKKKQSDVYAGQTLFIRNLSYGVSEDELKATFEQYGPVLFAKLVMNKDTGESRYASTVPPPLLSC